MLNIAIDGYVGSGKSTLANEIAKKLNLKMLDTGAIYRSIACEYRSRYDLLLSADNVEDLVKNMTIEVTFKGREQHVLINGKDYFGQIREEEISILTSQIAPYISVREKVLSVQRAFAKQYDCVMEGRDIGTIVLPKADFKFFLTGSEKTRAKRRYDQIKDKQTVSFEQILKDLQARDYNDTHRKIAPLVPAKDSIIIDTTFLTLEETVNKCIDIIKTKNTWFFKCFIFHSQSLSR